MLRERFIDGFFQDYKQIIKVMDRRQLSPNKSANSNILNVLPLIEQRKQSLSFEEQQRYLKNKIIPSEITTGQTHPEMEGSQLYRPIKNEISFLFQKEAKKPRIPLTPKKIEFRERQYQTIEQGNGKRQMQITSDPVKKPPIQSQIKAGDKQLPFKMANDRPSNRAYLYQPFRKSTTNKDRLKPIVQNLNFINQSDFLNVGKMVLLEGSSKKSNFIANNEVDKEKEKAQIVSHKLMIKEGNGGIEKMRVDRLKSLNNQAHQHEQKLERSHIKQASKIERQKMQVIEKMEKESNLYTNGDPAAKIEQLQTSLKKQSPPRRNRRQLNIPFETYYYRDLLWKVNFTNELNIEVPIEYEHRLKVHVGRGNNSCMVAGLIARRNWFAFTDRPEEANFLWTQLKVIDYYKKQQPPLNPYIQPQSHIQHSHAQGYQSSSLLTAKDLKQYNIYMSNFINAEEHGDQRLLSRGKNFKYRRSIRAQEIRELRMQNHLINNYVIGNKKALFNTMANYYKETGQEVFDFLPLTFHITDGMDDKKYFQFLRYYHKRAKEISRSNQQKGREKQYNAWIVKPGENSNRGNGIKMCLTLEEIKTVLKKREQYKDGTYRTYIVQAYIERPMLYCKRKFDLRHYIMMTCVNGLVKGYWYRDGYVRTTSSEYSLQASDGSIHLTNDAVQKNLPDYGKFEKGNKLSYEELSAYIDKHYSKKGKGGFYDKIYPRMKRMATDAMRACSGGIDPGKLESNFQVFGMDFMIDANLDVWLIEINSNPCLQLSCPLLASLIPKMVENALELTLDAMFIPPVRYSPKGVHYFKELEKENKFELVYDERVQRLYTGSLEVLDKRLLDEEDDTFEDCGQDWEDN